MAFQRLRPAQAALLLGRAGRGADADDDDGAGRQRVERRRRAAAERAVRGARREVRARGAVGLVGAGGIGQDLYVAIRQFEYTDISAIMLLLILTTSVIDITCEAIRHRLIGHTLTQVA